ncbi:MAG TPA: transcription elongation factor GreB [Thiotrichales bacterium]|nr:transcription elongation factor GreB [Thiotrichales bacterium]
MKHPPYITEEGHRRLQQELDALWRRRAEVTRALAAAAAEGDRSENAEYIYRKKELRGIDRRIRYLQRRLPELRVVRELPADRERIHFGAWVLLEDESGELVCHRIVGSDEFDPGRGWISVASPLARALIGRRRDEEIRVKTPEGERHLWIAEVSYTGPIDAD